MSTGPVPSSLVLLRDLRSTAPGTKVRFLGWYVDCRVVRGSFNTHSVDEYRVQTGTLRLKHEYPPAKQSVTANVDIEHVLERISRQEIDVGTWINVIGYVQQRTGKDVYVQAVAVWDAGNVDLIAYEQAVEKRKEVM